MIPSFLPHDIEKPRVPIRRTRRIASVFVVAAAALLTLPVAGWGTGSMEDEALHYLKTLSIEDLLQTQVTSVSKRNEKLSDAAAAVFVITAEDIQRMGAHSIPEVLRVVPGLHVARIDANKWAITARGFNNRFSNKLLVLMDGRTVYSPLFSGAYWDVQDTILADIQRIEVIRGPGATLWGANAVNGIINIITKSSNETQGGLVSFTAGTHTRYSGSVRYGGKVGRDTTFRIFAKGKSLDDFDNRSGGDAQDEWESRRSGFRLDTVCNESDEFTIFGDIYDGEADQTLSITGSLTPPFLYTGHDRESFSGGSLMGRWRHTFSTGGQSDVQLYYDRTERRDGILGEIRDTLDFDAQHRWQLTNRQELVWGLGYRFTRDDTDGTFSVSFTPPNREDHLFSAFLQDTIEVFRNRLWLTIGTKIEHNDYTGGEIQPNARLRWKPTDRTTVWGAISRAVRTPSRTEHDIRVNMAGFPDRAGMVNLMAVMGDDDYKSEELIAYEMGFRWHPGRRFSLDIASFYNAYDRLRAVTMGTSFTELNPPPPHTVWPLRIDNTLSGETYGAEFFINLLPSDVWKVSIGYSWLHIDLDPYLGGSKQQGLFFDGNSPEHQIQVRSYLDLPGNLRLDNDVYYMDELSGFDISGYWRVDIRIAWEPLEHLNLSFGVDNLLDDQHPEFGNHSGIIASDVPRSLYGRVEYRF